ncbi:non-ribosomal peptide synthetase [Balneola sp. MJW-20]|uniref:non-ribosomal peptide synthetase n=1 Tax=Gracilimonas aurantiaca TaxID=3234185 RepID=UPI003465C462
MKVKDPSPLTFTQESLWFLDRLKIGNNSNYLSAVYTIRGDLDPKLFQQSLQYVYLRHEVLRTVFMRDNDNLFQVLSDEADVDLSYNDLRDVKDSYSVFQSTCLSKLNEYMDLEKGPLFMGIFFSFDENVHRLFIKAHQIIIDEFSFGILMKELLAVYGKLVKEEDPDLPDLKLSYYDYAHSMHSEEYRDLLDEDLEFWKKELIEAPTETEFPTDRSRSAMPEYNGARHEFLLGKQTTKRLKLLAEREEVTLLSVFISLYCTFVYRYSGDEDVVLGVPVSLRKDKELLKLIGMFENMIPVRNKLSGEMSFSDFLNRSNTVLQSSLEHSEVPFNKLVTELAVDRNHSANPVFQHCVDYRPDHVFSDSSGDITIHEEGFYSTTSNFDLSWQFREFDDDIRILVEYRAELFDEETITNMGRNFIRLAEDVTVNPKNSLCELTLVSDEEINLLDTWNSTEYDYKIDRSFQQWLTDIALNDPDQIALVFEGGAYTFQELHERIDAVAAYLQSEKIGKNDIVGIYTGRNRKMIIGILGIMKAGAAYLPLDPKYPTDRKKFMVRDTGCKLILTEEMYRDDVSNYEVDFLSMDSEWEKIKSIDTGFIMPEVDAEDLAYIIYTSGSTGSPKGVMATYGNLLHYSAMAIDEYGLTAGDTVLQFGTMNFDVFIEEIFPPYLTGACIVLRNESCALGGEAFWSYIEQHKITYLTLPTAFWQTLCSQANEAHVKMSSSVRILIIGGEAMSNTMLERWQYLFGSRIRLVNTYGPSETTVVVTAFDCEDYDTSQGQVPIGTPLKNIKCYILDAYLNRCPIGAKGELYIHGPQVSKGYLNRPDLTKNRFIEDPFTDDEQSKLYKTGDIVKHLRDGNIVFIGRNDFQVKLRGLRIELGEIESAMNRQYGIKEAIAIVREDIPGEKRIVAYVVPENLKEPLIDIRPALRKELAGYMIPSAFVTLEKLPLTSNGKIDRNSLPAPERHDMTHQSEIILPATELEKKILKIWERVLNMSPISMEDNFFDIGGHSLIAVKLFDELRSELGIELPLAALFEAPNIRQLSSYIKEDQDRFMTVSASPLVEINGSGDKSPFFCVHGHFGNVLNFATLSRELGKDQPFYGLQGIGFAGVETPLTRIEEIADRYVKEIKSVQKDGPYSIGGYCFGTLVALEVASRLLETGDEVEKLVMFDPQPNLYPELLNPEVIERFEKFQASQRLANYKKEMVRKSTMELLGYFMARVKSRLVSFLMKRGLKLYDVIFRITGITMPAILRDVEFTNHIAMNRYVVKGPWEGDLDLILSRQVAQEYSKNLESDWSDLAKGSVRIHFVDDNGVIAGGEMFKKPYVSKTAENLSRVLDSDGYNTEKYDSGSVVKRDHRGGG